MRKKTSKKSEAPVAEIIEQAVEQIQQAAAAAAEQPKRRKMVEFSIFAFMLAHSTEKAQLIEYRVGYDPEVKIWLPKSLANFIADGDDPAKMICRIPAWLYYKTGLNNYFPVERWSSVAI